MYQLQSGMMALGNVANLSISMFMHEDNHKQGMTSKSNAKVNTCLYHFKLSLNIALFTWRVEGAPIPTNIVEKNGF